MNRFYHKSGYKSIFHGNINTVPSYTHYIRQIFKNSSYNELYIKIMYVFPIILVCFTHIALTTEISIDNGSILE